MRGFLVAYRRVLRDARLTRLLAGETVSSIGDWIYLVAILVLIYERTGDPVLLGLVGAARVAPYVVLSIPAGIVADRYDHTPGAPVFNRSVTLRDTWAGK